ncbi:hypothetical protein [Paenibacillus aquistagni]|uniref:hypothetical protein n=1 Tax=Paenibacillus aquistagni TaxID=1852522 RepID=UPI000B5127C9|nr:hypothetical protein [Paenibacillus aquistagni]
MKNKLSALRRLIHIVDQLVNINQAYLRGIDIYRSFPKMISFLLLVIAYVQIAYPSFSSKIISVSLFILALLALLVDFASVEKNIYEQESKFIQNQLNMLKNGYYDYDSGAIDHDKIILIITQVEQEFNNRGNKVSTFIPKIGLQKSISRNVSNKWIYVVTNEIKITENLLGVSESNLNQREN